MYPVLQEFTTFHSNNWIAGWSRLVLLSCFHDRIPAGASFRYTGSKSSADALQRSGARCRRINRQGRPKGNRKSLESSGGPDVSAENGLLWAGLLRSYVTIVGRVFHRCFFLALSSCYVLHAGPISSSEPNHSRPSPELDRSDASCLGNSVENGWLSLKTLPSS